MDSRQYRSEDPAPVFNAWHPPSSEYDGISRLYLPASVDTDDFTAGEYFTLGDSDENHRGPMLHGTVDELTQCSYNSFKSLTTETELYKQSTDVDVDLGYSLFYLPMLDGERDHYLVNKSLDVQSSKLSNVFRCMLGETVTGLALAKEIQNSSCPFFSTIADEHLISAIDWTSLDELVSLMGQNYRIPKEKITDNIFDMLKQELLFHSATMVREFDHLDLMWKYRIRKFDYINATAAMSSGLLLSEGKAQRGEPGRHTE